MRGETLVPAAAVEYLTRNDGPRRGRLPSVQWRAAARAAKVCTATGRCACAPAAQNLGSPLLPRGLARSAASPAALSTRTRSPARRAPRARRATGAAGRARRPHGAGPHQARPTLVRSAFRGRGLGALRGDVWPLRKQRPARHEWQSAGCVHLNEGVCGENKEVVRWG